MDSLDSNLILRAQVFAHLRRLIKTHDQLTTAELQPGFIFEKERIELINSRGAIFKPIQMDQLLSIKTAFPAVDARIWYDDPSAAHASIYAADVVIDCTFKLTDVDATRGDLLGAAAASRVPIVYFVAASPRHYQAIFPAFVMEWDATALRAKLAFGVSGSEGLTLSKSKAERRAALHALKQRLYQASFREAVITAYKGKCALSGLLQPRLLDVAHITDDGAAPGQPVVTNGIPLSKALRAAFDSNLIGIDPSFRVHVAKRPMQNEEMQIVHALKLMNYRRLHMPHRRIDRPDRDRLASRFKAFTAASS